MVETFYQHLTICAVVIVVVLGAGAFLFYCFYARRVKYNVEISQHILQDPRVTKVQVGDIYSFFNIGRTQSNAKMVEHILQDRRVTKVQVGDVVVERQKPLPLVEITSSSKVAIMAGEALFQDIFVVDKLDPVGKKFDKKVSRIEAHSDGCDMFMHLDVNTEIYPMAVNDKFTMALATTLNLDGTPDTGYYTQGGKRTLADKYDYVMHGKLFKILESGSGKSVKAEVYVSFGGLLMMLQGDPSHFNAFKLDQRLSLLIRKL